MRVCTYNVKNLFLDGEGAAKPEREVRPLARMIDQVGAEILVLQEVGSAESLARLNARLAAPYPFCETVTGNSNRSIHLGLMARRPLQLTSHRQVILTSASGQPLQYFQAQADAVAQRSIDLGFQRDLLLAEIEVQTGVLLALFCVHLKSRTNQPWQMQAADVMRAAECRAMRDVVADYARRHPQALICLLGDFNDRVTSDALTSLDDLCFTDPLGNLLKHSGRNPSTYWPKRRLRIDHIFVDRNALACVVPDSPRIHVSAMARTASDHYPVSLELSLHDLGMIAPD